MKQKEWVTMKELIGAPGMPKTLQGVHKKATKEEWIKEKEGTGRTYMYYVDCLPLITKEYIESGKIGSPKDKALESFNVLVNALGVDGLEQLAEVVRRKGADAVLLSERSRQVAIMVDELEDDAQKEILLLITEAKCCQLVGRPFSNHSTSEIKNRA